jgi:hypothetical protein
MGEGPPATPLPTLQSTVLPTDARLGDPIRHDSI